MANILGVGLLLFHRNSGLRVYTVQELRSKPSIYKEAGMISFPLETHEERDQGAKGTIHRLVGEEMGIEPREVENLVVVSEKFNLIPGREDIFTTYGFGFFTGDPNRLFQPKDDDIAFSGWRTIEKLLASRVRVEVVPILDHFQRNYLQHL